MKIEGTLKVTEITHDELVDLFSTALYGSSYLDAEYNKDDYNDIPEDDRVGECFEDKIADTLLHNGMVYVFDNYAEGEVYSSLGEIIEEPDGSDYGIYSLTLPDILAALTDIVNGKHGDYLKSCFGHLKAGEGDMDLTEADALMQVIMFNEVIYG